MRWLKSYSSLLLLLFCSAHSIAQQSTRYFSKENGLPSNVIYHSIQDSKGFLWFTTDKGVSKFDGYSFTNYTIDDGLTDNEVFKVYEDFQHRIWFLTYNGKLCYYKDGKIYNEQSMPFLGSVKNQSFFSKIFETANHNLIFIKEYSKELYRLTGNTFTKVELDQASFVNGYKKDKDIYIVCLKQSNKSDRAHYIYRIAEKTELVDSIISTEALSNFCYFNDNAVYLSKGVSGKEGVLVHFGKTIHSTKAFQLEKESPDKNTIIYCTVVHDGLLYIGTSSGMFVFNGSLNLVDHYLPSQATTSVLFDFEKGMWITTKNGGLYYYFSRGSNSFSNVRSYLNTIIPNPYNANELWLTGVGEYYVYNNTTQKCVRYPMPVEMGTQELTTDIGFLDKEHLIVGNGTGVLFHVNGKQTPTPDKAGIKKIVVDGDSIYYARSNNIIIQHRDQLFLTSSITNEAFSNLFNKRALSLLKDKQHRIWFGTNEGVFYLLNGKLFQPFDNINTRINKIVQSADNTLVFCSDVNGVYIYDHDSVIHLSKEVGLLSNQVNSAFFDRSGTLWIGSVKGISRVARNKQLTITNYSSANGLADEFINDLYLYNDSTFLLTTPTGLYSYVYTRSTTRQKPRINLLFAEVNSQKVDISALENLEHNENNIELGFTGIAFSSNKNIEYWYSLKKDSSAWEKINSRNLTFVNLPPGKYSLMLKCKNIQGVWSDVCVVPIQIHGPFYTSPGFLLVCLLLIVIAVYLFFHFYKNKISKENRIERLIMESRQKALRAQLNPHFVFNALNSIQYLFLSGKDNEAQEYLGKFSSILRNTLNNSDKTFISISEELENLKLYAELEQVRKPGMFSCEFIIDDRVDIHQIEIPSMLLQPIIENSIWHGIEPMKSKGSIVVKISAYEEDYIEVLIRDNGIGYTNSKNAKEGAKKHVSKGTALIHERISTLNLKQQGKISFEIKDAAPGTEVRIILPKKY